MNTILILLGLFVAFIATIIGIFLVPFLAWLTGNFELYMALCGWGGIALLISLVLFLKLNKRWGIAVVISIPVFISSLITTIRFLDRAHCVDNYIFEYYNGVYNNFGIKIIDERIEQRPIIAYNSYGEKFIITWDYDETKDGRYKQSRLDEDGNCIRIGNRWIEDYCTTYDINGQINIYNTDGILIKRENPYLFSYYENDNSHYDHRYQYSGVNADYIGEKQFVNGKGYSIRSVARAEVIDWLEDDYLVQ